MRTGSWDLAAGVLLTVTARSATWCAGWSGLRKRGGDDPAPRLPGAGHGGKVLETSMSAKVPLASAMAKNTPHAGAGCPLWLRSVACSETV